MEMTNVRVKLKILGGKNRRAGVKKHEGDTNIE